MRWPAWLRRPSREQLEEAQQAVDAACESKRAALEPLQKAAAIAARMEQVRRRDEFASLITAAMEHHR